jgi:nitroreductase
MTMNREPTMSLMQAIHARRAIRSFEPDKVDEQAIRALLSAAVQAPTAVQLEPWAFVIVQDPVALKRISDRAKALANDDPARRMGRAPGAHAEGHVAILEDPRYNIFYDAGTLIAICARPLGPFVSADCWLAAENLMLTACALGLGSCCVGFAVRVLNLPETKAELDIPADVTVVAPIIVGVPRVVPAPVPRKPPVVLSWT